MALIRTNKAGSQIETVTGLTVTPVGSGYATSATVTLPKAYSQVAVTNCNINFANSATGNPSSCTWVTSLSGTTLTFTFTGVSAGINPGVTNTIDIIGVL